jgi:hypothetical protein
MAEINCPNQECGGTVLEGDRFCATCGTPVAEHITQDGLSWATPQFESANGRKPTGGRVNGDGSIPAPPAPAWIKMFGYSGQQLRGLLG